MVSNHGDDHGDVKGEKSWIKGFTPTMAGKSDGLFEHAAQTWVCERKLKLWERLGDRRNEGPQDEKQEGEWECQY